MTDAVSHLMRRFGIGDTPLIPMPGLGSPGRISLKAEYANPFGSVKDRAAAYLIAWVTAQFGPEVHLVESTSGNLGIALGQMIPPTARLTVVMDGTVPPARLIAVRAAGGGVEVAEPLQPGLTPRETRIELARAIGERPGHAWLNQYGNSEGVRAHHETTGPEILSGTNGDLDAVVASVGTGATICGIGAALRDADRSAIAVGVEPVGSTIAGGPEGNYLPAGAGMRGPSKLVRDHGGLIDRFAQVPDATAARWALLLRSRHGVTAGLTTGAAFAAAVDLASREELHVVVVAADAGDVFLPAMRALAASTPASADLRIRWPSPTTHRCR